MRNVLFLLVLAGCASSGPAGSPAAPARPATARSAPPAVVAADPAPGSDKPVLDVVFPAANGPAVDAEFALKERVSPEGSDYSYAGFRVVIGDAPARLVAPGGELTVKLPVPANGVLRFHVDGKLALAAVAPGDRFRFTTHPLGGEWNADVLSAGPWNPAYERCLPEGEACREDETDEPSSVDDPACPGETHRFCVRSPRVRLRGPIREEVRAIGPHAEHDDPDNLLVAGGPAVPMYMHHCRQPYVVFGEEEAVLLTGYGEDWTVFRNAAGEIDASVTAIAVTSP